MSKKIYALFAAIALVVMCGCGQSTTTQQGDSVGQTSVTVEGDMEDEDASEGGVQVEMPGASVDTTGGGVHVDTPGVTVDID